MGLREKTRKLIKSVEELSGIPVNILETKDLQTFSNVMIARESGLPHHIIQYKRIDNEDPDYMISFQCGYILRLFTCTPDQRFDIYATDDGIDEVITAFYRPRGIANKYRLNKNQTQDIARQMINGLIGHLRSIPIGLRISDWIRKEKPEMKELEFAHVKREIEVNKQNFSRNIKSITPYEIYQPTQTISAAYAIHWAEIYKKQEWINPYILSGYEKDARMLLKSLKEIPEEPKHDRQLIETWGKILEISDWYAFAQYQPYQGQ